MFLIVSCFKLQYFNVFSLSLIYSKSVRLIIRFLMNLQCPPQFLWLFQACEESCPDFYISHNLEDSVKALYSEKWNDPMSSSGKQLSNSELYKQIALFIFGIQNSNEMINANAIDILHQNGYFIRYTSNLFELGFSIQNYLSITECLMWAFLDHHLPINEMSIVLGKLKSNLIHESETSICRWINTIVSKHSNLPSLNVIGKQFFGMPYFRIILYHFTRNDILMSTTDSKINNAKISFDFCNSNNIIMPFDLEKIEQPPLCILCFLCNVIKILDKIKFVKKNSFVITDSLVAQKLNGIQQLRTEVNQITKRCNKLSDEVNFFSQLVKSRPHSSITKSRRVRISSNLLKKRETAKPALHSEPAPRVSWDPNVIKLRGILKSRTISENEPSNI